MEQVQREWKTADLAHLKDLLANFRPKDSQTADLRAFEWYYWWRLFGGRRTEFRTLTLSRAAAPITSVAFSPDGMRIATGGYDRTVRIWDVESGKLVKSLEGHEDVVNSVTFSPDGRCCASSAFDSCLRIWDVATEKTIHHIRDRAFAPFSVAFVDSGRRFAAAKPDSIWRKYCQIDGGHVPNRLAQRHALPSVDRPRSRWS